jgi:AcrR family transcriptional regulator
MQASVKQSAKVSTARPRDAQATRKRVLNAATVEFARHGLAGARVDAIALRAKANKQLLYHYFGSKQGLYLAVLEQAYGGIREAERELDLESLDPLAALRTLVTFTWEYYLRHPEFLALVNNENLCKAEHLPKSDVLRGMHEAFRARLAEILARGARTGIFRRGVDADQLNLTIAAIGYYYLTNRYTNSIIYGTDLMTPEALQRRLAFNLETILRLVCKDGKAPSAPRRGRTKPGEAFDKERQHG